MTSEPTTDPTTDHRHGAPPSGPPARLYRLTDHKRVAGVCAGLGWYLGVDPVLVRIAFVVGGFATGPLAVGVYVVAALVMPTRRSAEVAAHRPPDSDGRTRALTALGIVLALSLLGALDWFSGQVVLAAGLIGVGVLLLQGDRGGAGTSAPWPQRPRTTTTGDAAGTSEGTATGAAGEDRREEVVAAGGAEPPYVRDAGAPASAYDRRYAGAHRPSHRPPHGLPDRRSTDRGPRSRLGPITIALTVLVLGLVSLLERLGLPVDLDLRSGLAIVVGIAGLGLLVGTVLGRGRGLIAVGLLGTAALLGLQVAEEAGLPGRGGVGEQVHRPAVVADVADRYELLAGDLLVDLSAVPLGGEVLDVEVDAGMADVTVIVPPDVEVVVEGTLGAGDATVFGDERTGSDVSLDAVHDGAEGAGRLLLDVDQWLGDLTITEGGPR